MFTTIHLIHQSANETTPFDTYTVPTAFVPAVGDKLSLMYTFFNTDDTRTKGAYVRYPNGEERLLPKRQHRIPMSVGSVSPEDQAILASLSDIPSDSPYNSPAHAYLTGLDLLDQVRYSAELEKMNLPPNEGIVTRIEAVDDHTVNLYI